MKENSKEKNISKNPNFKNANVNTTEQMNTKIRKGTTLRKILRILDTILTTAIIIITVIILVRAFVFKKYDILGYRFYIIMSGSMEPEINVADAVITKQPHELNVGDVIAFQHTPKTTTVHRIIEIQEENGEKLYKTKGDNNNTPDKKIVKNENIRGVVVQTVPKVGNVITFLKSHLIIVILIAGIIIIALLGRMILNGRK